MKIADAVKVAETCGADTAPFYGEVVMRIHAGEVKEVQVLQTFREGIPQDAA